jgi:hypothetical protein
MELEAKTEGEIQQEQWYLDHLNTLPPQEAYPFISRERERLSGWRFLLNLSEGQEGLVLATGRGTVACSLSRYYHRLVVAQEKGDASHLSQRATDTHRNNMAVVGVSFLQPLPFGDTLFDCVILYDIGTFFPKNRSKALHLRQLLFEAHRVLKKDGTLVVISENNNWVCQIRSALKYLKNRILTQKDRTPYFAQDAFGCHQVNSILRDIGFQQRHLFGLSPHLSPFADALPIDPHNDAKWPRPSPDKGLAERNPSTTTIKPSPLLLKKWTSPAFAITATHAETQDSFLNQFSTLLLHEVGGETVTLQKYINGKPDVVILIYKIGQGGKEAGVVARLPLTKISLARCQRNMDTVHLLSKRNSVLWGKVPRKVCAGTLCGQPYFVESLFPGTVMLRPNAVRLQIVVNEAAPLLTAFHKTCVIKRLMDKSAFDQIASPFFHGVLPFLKNEEMRGRFQYVIDGIQERLLGTLFPLVYSHGDFQAENMILDPTTFKIEGIIDWDLSQSEGLPLHDLLYLLLYKETLLGRGDFETIFLKRLLPLRLDPEDENHFTAYQQAIGIASDHLLPLQIFFWLHHIAFRIEPVWPQFTAWMNSAFYPVFLQVEKAIRQKTSNP